MAASFGLFLYFPHPYSFGKESSLLSQGRTGACSWLANQCTPSLLPWQQPQHWAWSSILVIRTRNYIQTPRMDHYGKLYNKKRMYVCMYDWVTFLYSRNWHNISNELYFNKTFKKISAYLQKNRRWKSQALEWQGLEGPFKRHAVGGSWSCLWEDLVHRELALLTPHPMAWVSLWSH